MGRPKGGKNRSWTCDEKIQLIQGYYASGKGYKAFAEEHGIAHSLFNNWLKKYNEGGPMGLQHKKRNVEDYMKWETTHAEEILQLKLIIANQQIEIEKLKAQIEADRE